MARGAGSEDAGERRALSAGALVVVAIALLDVLLHARISLVGYLVLGPLFAATRARPRHVAVLAAAAFLIGLPLGADNHIFLGSRHLVGLGLIVAGGTIAVALARALTTLRGVRSNEAAAHERLTLIDRSSRLIAAPLDTTARLQELTRLPIPDLGALCVIDLLADDGTIGGSVVSAERDDQAEAIRTLRRNFPIDPAGPHPVAEAISTGKPRLYADVDDAALTSFTTDTDHIEAMQDLRYGSIVVVPLIARDRTLGAMCLLRFEGAPAFDEADLALIADLAGRAALSVDNARLYDDLLATERRLQAILSVVAEAVTVQDREGRLAYVNEAAERLLRVSGADEVLGTPIEQLVVAYEMFGEDGEPLTVADLPGAVALRGEEPRPTLVRWCHRETGDERWTLLKASAIHDEHGEPVLSVTVIEEVTELRRESERTALLAEASNVLATTDYERGLQRLAEAVAPGLVACCVVELADERGGLVRVAACPEGVQAAPEATRALRRGAAELRADGSAIVAPLLAGDEVVGVVTLAQDASRRRLGGPDLALARELGRRAGLAVVHARVHLERTHVATTLQRSLLPPRLPAIPGLSIAARFRAAGSGNQVGGDFYDVFEVDGGWIVVIGDVTGKGPDAAAITSLARYTMRTAARYEPSPTDILHRLNEMLLREAGDRRRLCTAVCLRIEEAVGARPLRATVACAGHPPPYRLSERGTVEAVSGPGPLLGAFDDARWRADAVDLLAGDSLVLYTDGVTDTTGASERFGDERLQAAIGAAAGRDADGLAGAIDDALLAFQEGPQRDDVALLVLSTGPARAVGAPAPLAEATRA